MGRQRKKIDMGHGMPLFVLWWVLKWQSLDILLLVRLDSINLRFWLPSDEAFDLLPEICYQFFFSVSLSIYQPMSNCNANLVGCMSMFSPVSHSYGAVL